MDITYSKKLKIFLMKGKIQFSLPQKMWLHAQILNDTKEWWFLVSHLQFAAITWNYILPLGDHPQVGEL